MRPIDQVPIGITLVLVAALWVTWRSLRWRSAMVVTVALVATVVFVPLGGVGSCVDFPAGSPHQSRCTMTVYSLVGIRYPGWGSAVTAVVFGAWLVVFLVFVARHTWRAME